LGRKEKKIASDSRVVEKLYVERKKKEKRGGKPLNKLPRQGKKKPFVEKKTPHRKKVGCTGRNNGRQVKAEGKEKKKKA